MFYVILRVGNPNKVVTLSKVLQGKNGQTSWPPNQAHPMSTPINPMSTPIAATSQISSVQKCSQLSCIQYTLIGLYNIEHNLTSHNIYEDPQ